MGRVKRNLGITNRPGSKSTSASCEGKKEIKKVHDTFRAEQNDVETSCQIRIVDSRYQISDAEGCEAEGKKISVRREM